MNNEAREKEGVSRVGMVAGIVMSVVVVGAILTAGIVAVCHLLQMTGISKRVYSGTEVMTAGMILLAGGAVVAAANFFVAVVRPVGHWLRGGKPEELRNVSMVMVVGTLFLGYAAWLFYSIGHFGCMRVAIVMELLNCGGAGLIVWAPVGMAWEKCVALRRR